MKKTIIVGAAVVSVIGWALSCNSSSKSTFQQSKPDTTKTAAIFMGGTGYVEGGIVFRISKDTFAFDSLDTETIKKKWKRDTTYYIPQIVPLTDSLGKAVLDSLGKPQQTVRYFPTPNKNILEDYNRKF
jgi:hypothetical protein